MKLIDANRTSLPTRPIAEAGAEAVAGAPVQPPGEPRMGRWENFWLNYLFWHAEHAPWVIRATRVFYLTLAWHVATSMRRTVMTNVARLMGAQAPLKQRRKVARRIIANFYLFVHDIGCAVRMSREQLLARIKTVEGHDRYQAARQAGKGAILVTAHMGSFEVGAAALRELEPMVHVVFRRDVQARFERLRKALHEKLGLIEAPVDDGWGVWMRLRDALGRNEVVLMQGDRVMPGQKGVKAPFLGGHMLVPAGPVKLALATGAPLIPIFALRQADGKVKLIIEEAIDVRPDESGEGRIHPALVRLVNVIERYVKAYPEQWLTLHYACCEDADARQDGHGK